MPSILPRRAVRRLIARAMPDRLKKAVQGRLYGYHRSRVALSVEFGQDDTGSFVLIDGLRLRFREEERAELGYHLVRNGASIEETSGFLALARPARVLFDIGAAKAMYSRLFCLTGSTKRAIAFEPSPRQAAAASRAIEHCGCGSQTVVRECAVGSLGGRAAGRLADDGFAYLDGSSGALIDLEVTSLDREVETLGLVPDLLKIDVEGWENEVLAGATNLLRAHRPPICLELHLGVLESRRISPRQVVEQLQQCGYRFRTHWGKELRPSQVWDSISAVLRVIAY
jgi:FkbM family methyltransferase